MQSKYKRILQTLIFQYVCMCPLRALQVPSSIAGNYVYCIMLLSVYLWDSADYWVHCHPSQQTTSQPGVIVQTLGLVNQAAGRKAYQARATEKYLISIYLFLSITFYVYKNLARLLTLSLALCNKGACIAVQASSA